MMQCFALSSRLHSASELKHCSFLIHDPSFIISSRHVTFATLRHSSWLMSSSARSKQMAHGLAIFKLRPIRDSRPEFMTGAARVGSGRQENKFPVRIDARSISRFLKKSLQMCAYVYIRAHQQPPRRSYARYHESSTRYV